ncbi:PAS domain-containing protein [Blastomonas sp.]|uniref:PAS domain-containing protein n=1 Tax=Blastomonas sp. TaxID=1909299 RepID=UPI0035934B6E
MIHAGGGELGALMRGHDWSTSSIGYPDTWPPALQTAVSMMLPSKHVMFVAWGPDLAFLYNDAYRPVFGNKHPWALGRPFREVWSEVWAEITPLVETALSGEATWSENLPLVLERNGYPEDCWFTFSYSPLRDDNGNIAGLFCAAAETTESVLAERRLVAERERQQQLFEHVPGFVGVLRGPDHVFEYANDAYDRVAGKRGFVGQTVRAAFPELKGTGVFEALDLAYATGEPYVARDVALSLQRTPGAEPDPLFLTFTYQPIVDERGKVTGIFLQGQDVTQEHQAVAALTHLNATLEQQVSERTRELLVTEAALRQAQKMEAIGQLTGGVAHDFNNLLTPIMGALDILIRRKVGNEREQRMIDGALQSANRAKTLVQRLLAFARRQPLQAVAVDLATLIDGMAALIASTVGPQIIVRVELDENLPPASADANQLEMAILNLGVNARDAMPGGGTLTITAVLESVRGEHRSGLNDGNYVRLSVADTGTGMDEATLARATEPFFSTKGVGAGTGLGLPMVHGLAAQLGGGLTIISELGHGSALELWLPVSLDPLGEAVEAKVAVTPVRPRLCALLVDDEPLVRMCTADMLTDLGYDVLEASSGEQALRLLDEGVPPDIIITDYLMPGMSGAELVSAVRDRKPGLPILIISGYAEPEEIPLDWTRLTKPFRSADLAQSIANLMRENAAEGT